MIVRAVRRALPAVLLVTGCLAALPLFAGTGQVYSLPLATKKPVSGFRLVVDNRWVEGYGYRPIRVTATALKAANQDRTLTIHFRANNWVPRPSNSYAILAVQDLDLPAGKTVAATTIAVPQYEPWHTVAWDVLVDGSLADELSSPWTGGPSGGVNTSTDVPNVLVVGSGSAVSVQMAELLRVLNSDYNGLDVESLVAMWSANAAAGANVAFGGGTFVPPMPAMPINTGSMMNLPAAELPTRWIDYSSIDIVYLSVDQFEVVVRKHPAAWQAMRAWISAGGNLWVCNVGDDWSGLSRIDELLGEATAEGENPLERGWHKPDSEAIAVNQQRRNRPNGMRGWAVDVEPEMDPGSVEPAYVPERLMRDVMLGRVVALADKNPFMDSKNQPASLDLLIDFRRALWAHRHGLMPDTENEEFWNWLIPGVGLAPVTEFRVLITLFVVLIGPVNYFLLRRRGRLQWLLITVPLSAAIVTGGLFLYALAADGLGTRVRVRSFTQIDQRRGDAVCWSRMSYYSGLAPRDGMEFSSDTLVLPILPSTGRSYGYPQTARAQSREIEWHNQQLLAEGWLASRTPTQYLTVRSRKSELSLNATERDGRVTIDNQLGAPLKYVFLSDTQGQTFYGASIAEEQQASLQPLPEGQVVMQLRNLLAAHTPQLPTSLATGNSGSVFGFRRYGYYAGRYNDGGYGAPLLVSSVLEQSLAALIEPGSTLPSRSYVALLDHSPEVSLGIPSAREEASLHVIFGRW